MFLGDPAAPQPLVNWEARKSLSDAERRELSAKSFALRCASPAVVRCVSFDTPDQIPEYRGRGTTGIVRAGPSALVPDLDCTVAVDGCSLRFTIPSHSGAGSSGSWFADFSDDLSVRFGEGEEFYVQWRQRFSRSFLDTRFEGAGWKQAIIGEGDRAGKVVYSCTQLELVVQNTYQRGYPQMYHSCGGKDGHYEPLADQSAIDYEPDQWMTFQVRAKIGTWYKNDRKYRRDSTVELWVGREGEASYRGVMAKDYDIANNTPDAKYGKVWLLPYHTGKDAKQDHPVGYTWYDELIVSRAPIPDP
jgi:hypothetical protein